MLARTTLRGLGTVIREWPGVNSPCLSCSSPILRQSQSVSFHGQTQDRRKYLSAEDVQREKDCKTLGVPNDCKDEAMVRDAYLKLAKRYHPDSGSPEASTDKFHEIDSAYKNFLKYFADFRHNRHKIEGEYGLYYKPRPSEGKSAGEEGEVESPDIRHTAPQHRQYLSYDGIGSGTPREREKQYQKWRAMKAMENVLEHRMEQVSQISSSNQEVRDLAEVQKAAKKTKTGIGIDRLVEDMIQEAMAKGDFDNLTGKGKPLNSVNAYNPYIDFTTHKLNQVLIDNGFAPEWILLEKEVKEELRRIRAQLKEIRHIFSANLSNEEMRQWENYIEAIRPDCDQLNKNILKYNLTVPSLHKQVVGLQLDKVAEKILANFDPEFHEICKVKDKERKLENARNNANNARANTSSESFLDSLMSIFKT